MSQTEISEMLISPSQLNAAQIKNDLTENGLTAKMGLCFQANYKVHIKHGACEGSSCKGLYLY